MRRARRIRALVAAAAVVGGAGLLGNDAWLSAKAALARRLIDRALERHLSDGGTHPPWSWADTHPVARLRAPRVGVERVVLSGSSGAVLAFGPGHVPGTAPPGTDGNTVVAGHRDGSFAFLRDLRPGDRLEVQTHESTTVYEVAGSEVVNLDDIHVLAPTPDARLTLVTCYPFGSVLPGPRRYVVTAGRVVDAS